MPYGPHTPHTQTSQKERVGKYECVCRRSAAEVLEVSSTNYQRPSTQFAKYQIYSELKLPWALKAGQTGSEPFLHWIDGKTNLSKSKLAAYGLYAF